MGRVVALAAVLLVGLAGCQREPQPVRKTGNPFERASEAASHKQTQTARAGNRARGNRPNAPP